MQKAWMPFFILTPRSHKRVISGCKPIIILKYSPEFYINFSSLFIIVPSMETFEEHSILAKYKEGDNKDLGFWFIVTGFWLKEKNQKQQTRDRKPNLYSNRAKGGVMQRSHTQGLHPCAPFSCSLRHKQGISPS